jgi:hypothetical protein
MVTLSEKELIGKIKKLRQIRPRKDWVSLAKRDILGQEPTPLFFPYFKPVFATVIAVSFLFVTFGFAQSSLPGDLLYPIKKISDEGRAVFVSDEERPAFQIKMANERLEDLAKAQAKNLAPTINEFQASVSEAAKNLTEIETSSSNPVTIQKIVEETKKLEENKEKAKSLGVVIEGEETEEFDDALAKVVGDLIEDLEGKSLTEEKEEILNEMKELFGEERYSDALELYLLNQ